MWKQMLSSAAFAVAVASAGAAAPPGDGGWHTFASESGRFQVDLPADPVVRPDEGRFTLLGPVSGEIYAVQAGDLQLAIEVRDLPTLARALVPDELILDETRESVVADMDAVELRGGETTHQGFPAREFVYRIPGDPPDFERALAVLVEGRLYVVTGRTPRRDARSREIERFFDSFRIARERESGATASQPLQ